MVSLTVFMMSKTHREKDRARERDCCKGIRWECCEVSSLPTCLLPTRPAPSRSSYSADDCSYVEAITPFPGSDFIKERIKFHENMTSKIYLNNFLECTPGLKEMLSFFLLKECGLYCCANVDGKTSAR